jgi:hypothetical protein
MSKLAVAVLGLGLAVLGFGLGRYTAAPSGAGESELEIARAAGSESGAARAVQPGEALVEVLRDPNAFLRARRLASLLPTLGPEALAEVRAALGDLSLELWATEIELLVRFWAIHEPEEATDWAYRRAPAAYRTAAIAVALEVWAREDPQAALRRARTTPGSKTANEVAQVVLVRGWFDSGRPGLEDYIRDLGQSFEQQRAVGALARVKIQREGPEAVMRWAESLPDEPEHFKLAAYRQLASQLLEVDPDAARRWCDAHCDGPFGSNVRSLIATRWVVSDGPAAMKWLSTQAPGRETDFAVRMGFRAWVVHDREAAFDFMAAHGEPGRLPPWLEPAVVIYTNFLAQDDPAGAAKWAPMIENDEDREIAFIGLARRWRERDEAAAEAWLRQSPLSEEAREKARQPRPQRRPPPPGEPPTSPAP